MGHAGFSLTQARIPRACCGVPVGFLPLVVVPLVVWGRRGRNSRPRGGGAPERQGNCGGSVRKRDRGRMRSDEGVRERVRVCAFVTRR